MVDPGAIIVGSEEHKAVLALAEVMAEKFEIAAPAMLGQILKFYDAIRSVTYSEGGMAALHIKVDGNG